MTLIEARMRELAWCGGFHGYPHDRPYIGAVFTDTCPNCRQQLVKFQEVAAPLALNLSDAKLLKELARWKTAAESL